MRRKLVPLLIITAILVGLLSVHKYAKFNQTTSNMSPKPKVTNSQTTVPFDKTKYSINEASSLWAVVDKGRQLPTSYVPAALVAPSMPLRLSADSAEMHLRSDAAAAMEQMSAAAKSEGLNLMLASGYRSYTTQVAVYGAEVKNYGQTKADSESARPGHSEHQTGLAADLEPVSRNCELLACFGDTPEGKWLAANATKFGFIIRYPADKTALTGYAYEPWHVRYIGTDLAGQVSRKSMTLEQFFDLPAYIDYPAQSYQLQ